MQPVPPPPPCDACPSCQSITSGNAADVFEIDGASNNSVDQVRELRQNVTYMPVAAPRKIYIIDEVHMLSTAAFNALLKTLEEPPAHVLFIFATTEPHKIPITILSRCQRHNLGRISTTEIAEHLGRLCERENVAISLESLSLIAAEADGSMRDALSLLDRVISSSTDTEISHDHILNHLGIIDKKILLDMATAVLQQDGAAILGHIARVHDLGFDLKKIYADLIKTFRNIQVVKLCKNSAPPSDISAHDREQINALPLPHNPEYTGQLLSILLKEEQLIRFSSHTRTALETVLLQLIQVRPGTTVASIITRLDALARQVTSTGPSIAAPKVRPEGTIPPPPGPSRCSEPAAAYRAPQATHVRPSAPGTPPHAGETAEGSPPAAPHAAPPPSPDPSPTWEGFLKYLAREMPFIGAILSKSTFQGISNNQLKITLSGNCSFDLKRIRSRQSQVDTLCRNYFGQHLTLTAGTSTPQEAPDTAVNTGISPAKQKQAAMNHPLVTRAVEQFNGQIVDVQLKP